MDGLQWYPRYIGDYSRKTKQLSMLEHGAYTLLMDHYYATGKPILSSNATSNAELMPDHSRIYRLCSAITKPEQEAVDIVISMFFEWCENGYTNKRVEETIEKQRAAHEKRVSAGRKGGYSKAGSNAKAKPKQPEPEPDINPPTPQRGKEFSNLKIGETKWDNSRYNVEIFLDDNCRERTKKLAPGWCLYSLISTYNEGIQSGNRDRPDNPKKAFPAWCAKYTKGKKP